MTATSQARGCETRAWCKNEMRSNLSVGTELEQRAHCGCSTDTIHVLYWQLLLIGNRKRLMCVFHPTQELTTLNIYLYAPNRHSVFRKSRAVKLLRRRRVHSSIRLAAGSTPGTTSSTASTSISPS